MEVSQSMSKRLVAQTGEEALLRLVEMAVSAGQEDVEIARDALGQCLCGLSRSNERDSDAIAARVFARWREGQTKEAQ